jgi:phosphosulfolactate phosphohydrolase-like enzyme
MEPAATLTDAARAAIVLTTAQPDALEVFRTSASGQAILPLGLGDDLAFAAQEDRYAVAPRLVTGHELPLARWPVLRVAEDSDLAAA